MWLPPYHLEASKKSPKNLGATKAVQKDASPKQGKDQAKPDQTNLPGKLIFLKAPAIKLQTPLQKEIISWSIKQPLGKDRRHE